ncbi:hypothetical protein FBEOM_4832 [Fusarium beomiforme]|uniref:Uncharacterized protein n=1 Tax=Fusarium beomiforme TaxID=44412 RepID=A0A9P5E0K0_9HYPO|nr:hypothetical protein FBEOM_4832 [Fusarium beomiforme]
MGILRDVIGSTIESAQESSQKKRSPYNSGQMSPPRRNPSPYHTASSSSQSSQSYTRHRYDENPKYESYEQSAYADENSYDTRRQAGHCYNDEPPSYTLHPSDAYTTGRPRSSQSASRRNIYQRHSYSHSSPQPSTNMGSSSYPSSHQNGEFRLIAIPQTAFGSGEPFLRGYSSELNRYGITRDQFVEVLDTVNVARTPNPEAQLFQKGANIAGWFLPGVAWIGLIAGQVGVGIATAVGHSSIISKTLSKANMELFAPHGLEMCIVKTEDLDTELGISPYEQRNLPYNMSPVDRLNAYGSRIAYVDQILPDRSDLGRRDPLAIAGRALNKRSNQKKAEDAQEKLDKGEKKGKGLRRLLQLYDDIEWIVVRVSQPIGTGQ